MRILVVEDNERLAELVCKGLRNGGFAADSFGSLGDADAALSSVSYDAAILDLGLPDGDGMDLLKLARKRGQSLPVLLLTARDGVEDRVRGLNGGADDYLVKPFAMDELLARMRALLRRPCAALEVQLSCGRLRMDTTAREVLVDESVMSIPRREMELLEQLLRRAGRIVPKRALEEGLYGFDDDVSSNTLEVLLSRLRKRLTQAKAGVTIHTLRGVGYMLAEDECA